MKLSNKEKVELINEGTEGAELIINLLMPKTLFSDKERKRFMKMCVDMLVDTAESNNPLNTLDVYEKDNLKLNEILDK
tara:strand:- start:1986 stop:2219 length:234 start_codon:yes stop_codon:yes gene_type:complete